MHWNRGPDACLAGSEQDGRLRDEAASPGSTLDMCRVQGWGGTWETAGLAATALRAPAQPLGYTGSLCTISHSRRALTVWAHSSELEELATATLPERLLKVGEARRRGR